MTRQQLHLFMCLCPTFLNLCLLCQVRACCESVKQNGFVNYFGLQRFGQGNPTHLVGCALLKGDWKGAAQLILQPNASDDEETAAAKEHYLAGDMAVSTCLRLSALH